MHVIHVICYQDPDGRSPAELLEAWPTLTQVAAAAAGADVRVAVVVAARQDAVLDRGPVRCHFVADRRPGGLSRRLGSWAAPLARRIARRVRTLEPSLVHFHGLGFPRQVRLLRRTLPKIPILIQDHGDRPPRRELRFLFRRGIDAADGVAFTARDQARPFWDAGVLGADLPVFEILESSTTFAPGDRVSARAKTGLAGDPCLLWVGRLNVTKDPLTVLEAMEQAVTHLPDPQLWCYYTDAPLLDAVRARVSASRLLRGRVHLMGTVPHAEVEELLRAADFLVLASRQEGSGYAVLEALACGTPPLLTDIPSFRAVTGGGAVGSLTPVGDALALARALIDWSRRDRVRLREAARRHFEHSLSFGAVGAQLRNAYRVLVAPGTR